MAQSSVLVINFNEDLQSIQSSTNGDVTMLEVHNCPSTVWAANLISKHQFRSAIFAKLQKVCAIRLRIDEPHFNSKYIEQPKITEFDGKEKFLVSYEASDGRESFIFWKNGRLDNFLRLVLNDERQSRELTSFVIEFIISSFQSGQKGE
jgi:hypothetical protein